MDELTTVPTWLSAIEAKYGDRRKKEFASERPLLEEYLGKLLDTLATTYTFQRVIAVGGTGVVTLGHHNRFNQHIALKFNRPNLRPGQASMVANESEILPTLNHPNIVRVLDIGGDTALTPPLSYLIEPFIEGSRPLYTLDPDRAKNTWLRETIARLTADLPDLVDIAGSDDAGRAVAKFNEALLEVARIFGQWASLLDHVHDEHPLATKRFVYLDVKPENVLVDQHRHVTAIDFGSVEYVDTADHTPIEVYYTGRYAHPLLINAKKGTDSSNRIIGGVRRSDVIPVLDFYALGISLLEVLNAIATVRPNVVPQLPLYRALHFLATRLLDGKNTRPQPGDRYPHASQVFPGLTDIDYEALAYARLSDAARDIQKELGEWNLVELVPELAGYSKDIVRLVPRFNTVLTPRLRRVIEHPLVGRLKYITQLGLITLVYPTADHSRYDHALGAYTYATNYVKSLFNDLGNPLFRNLVAVEDVNAVLLAALLHDLGQYPLAHDLEEVHEAIFKHTALGIVFLEDSLRDKDGRTLLEIIEDAANGWGVPRASLKQILGAHSKSLGLTDAKQERPLKINVLAAIIDGPIDADKADYIIRDSSRCELPYGNQLSDKPE